MKLSPLFSFAFSCLFAAGLAFPAFADFRVAVVDVGKVLNDSDQAKENRKVLDGKSETVKKKLEDKRSQLRDLEKHIRDKELGENSKEVDQLRSQARDFDRMAKDAEDDLRKEYMKVNRGLSEKVIKVISAYARDKGFDVVLDKGEKIRGPVLYGDSSLEITSAILDQMNQ